MQDPYKILGIARDASDEEVKKAYRQLSKKYHPDANVGSPHLEEYTEMFKQVQNAYDQIMQERKGGGDPFAQAFHYQQQGNAGDSDLQAALHFIHVGHYEEAYQLLQRMPQERRNAEWYFLMGLSLWGKDNPIAAVENIKKACEMDPTNQQYRQTLAQMQSGQMQYQQMRGPFGGAGASCGPMCCCELALCSLCTRGLIFPFFCCY